MLSPFQQSPLNDTEYEDPYRVVHKSSAIVEKLSDVKFKWATNLKKMMSKLEMLRWLSGKSVHLWSCNLGFDSEPGRANNFKVGIHSFSA